MMEVTVVVFYDEEPIRGDGLIIAFATHELGVKHLKTVGYKQHDVVSHWWSKRNEDARKDSTADLQTVQVKGA